MNQIRRLRPFMMSACLALVACVPTNSGEVATTSTINSNAVDYNLPDGWQVAEDRLTPNVGDPREILAAGTFHLLAGGDNCAHMPEAAMESLGPKDALVSLSERLDPVAADFDPRQSSFGPLLSGISKGDAYECINPSERDDVGVVVWLTFRDGNRGFYLLVVMGTDVSDAVRQQTVELLDSLSFDN